MRSIIILLLLIFLVSLFTACTPTLQHLEISPQSSEYFIETEQRCGWCGGTNIFNLTNGEATFSHDYACEDFDDIDIQKINLSEKEWNNLISLLDFNAFQEIDLNTCALCADGCDTQITISKSGVSHSFTYSYTGAEELTAVAEFLKAFEILKKDKTESFY